jgi:hypothetical protein
MCRLAALALASALASFWLPACGIVPRQPMVCDQLPPDTCRRIAAVVVAGESIKHPVSLVVVNGYKGACPPLPIYCPLIPTPVNAPVAALVAVQFSDGAESVLRGVPDVSARPLTIHVLDSRFANALIETHQAAPRQ